MKQHTFEQVTPNIEYGGICNYETAKAVAKSVFSTYSKGDSIPTGSLERMLIDTYKLMNKQIAPTQDDIQIYSETLDRNVDGKITLEDLESLAIKFLVGEKNLGKKGFDSIVKGRLKVARRLFDKFDSDRSGYITEDEIPHLLIETYRQIGMTYNPSKEDIQAMMRMTDLDGDGKISFEDYEKLIIRSLQNCGIKIYQ